MSEVVVVSVEKKLDPIREKNFYLNVGVSSMAWMIFHFTVVYFFTFQLKSIALVGIFLGIGNFFSFILDISVGVIQRYFKPKTLFVISYIFEITAILIFSYFVIQADGFLTDNEFIGDGFLSNIFKFIFGNLVNLILLLFSAFCYGLTKELQDVTLLSYVLNNSDPSSYHSILAKKNLIAGIGALIGLISSGVILSTAPGVIIMLVCFIICLIIFFTFRFFDNGKKTLGLSNFDSFKIIFHKDFYKITGNNIKDSIVKSVSKEKLKDVINSSKYVFLKPLEKKQGLTFSLLITETKKELGNTYRILSDLNNYLVLYWALALVMIFGFWDNFASTFLIDFLDSLWKGGGYVLLALVAIPAYVLQDLFGKLSEKYGIYIVSNIGLIFSGASLILMGLNSDSKNIVFVMFLAMMNSVGYASCMSLSEAGFLESYNKVFAIKNNLKEIDSNASAAPLKIIGNLANVLGLGIGGVILGVLGYKGFFIMFGGLIIFVLLWTIKNKINKKTK